MRKRTTILTMFFLAVLLMVWDVTGNLEETISKDASTVATAEGDVQKKSLQPPKDVPPIIGITIATPSSTAGDDDYDKWSIKLMVPKVAWEVVGKEKPKIEWPRFNVTVKETILTLSMGYHPATQLSDNAQNRVLDLKGRRLSRKEVLKRLTAKTPVLVSVSGRMPDPFYLQCTKPDTLIVVLGIPYYPAPELLPCPKRPIESGELE